MKPISAEDRTVADPIHGKGPSPKPALSRLWIPTILLALFAAQSLWFIGTQSLTYDEPAHIIAGVEAWQQGRFEHWNDHPPLGRLWLTLPLARAHAEFEWQELTSGFRVTAMRPGPEAIAWRTRPMNTLLGLALGLAVWFAARGLFSEGAANLSLALFAFTPSLIAHFSLVTTDGIGTLFIFLTAFQVVRWRKKPTRRETVLLGLALGGLLLSKFYAPPLVLLALGLMLVLDQKQRPLPAASAEWKTHAGRASHRSDHALGGLLLSRVAPETRQRRTGRELSQPACQNISNQIERPPGPTGASRRVRGGSAQGGAR